MLRPPKDESEVRHELREGELVEEAEKDEETRPVVSLQTLIPDDPRLLEAMEFFLLAEPQRQLEQLGEVATLAKAAESAKTSGNYLISRINYEDAAKIGLYKQNKGEFRGMLALADNVTPRDEKYAQFHHILLEKTDRAMRVAAQYYEALAEKADKNRVPKKDSDS